MPTLPRISIVVPNYNGGVTLGRTLESLIRQNYPALEILVVDGGSTDNSLDVIKKYEPHLAWWVSEKDRGQPHAINKGFARSTGEVLNWIGSDDWLEPGALQVVGEQFADNPEVDVLVGGVRLADYRTQPPTIRLWACRERNLKLLPFGNPIPQPSCFYRRWLLDRQPPVDESYHFSMDLELWCHFLSRGARWEFIDATLSTFVFTGRNKSSIAVDRFWEEDIRLWQRYGRDGRLDWHLHLRRPLDQFADAHPGLLGAAARILRKGVTAIMVLLYGNAAVRLSAPMVLESGEAPDDS